MCMESGLCCGLLQCSCYTEHGRYGLSWLHAETVQCLAMLDLCSMLEPFKLWCEMWNMADMGHLLCKTVEWAKLPCSFKTGFWMLDKLYHCQNHTAAIRFYHLQYSHLTLLLSWNSMFTSFTPTKYFTTSIWPLAAAMYTGVLKGRERKYTHYTHTATPI